MTQMSPESSYESVSNFSPKVRIRVGFRFYLDYRVGVGFSVRIRIGLGLPVFFFLRLNILTHDPLTHYSLRLQSRCEELKPVHLFTPKRNVFLSKPI